MGQFCPNDIKLGLVELTEYIWHHNQSFIEEFFKTSATIPAHKCSIASLKFAAEGLHVHFNVGRETRRRRTPIWWEDLINWMTKVGKENTMTATPLAEQPSFLRENEPILQFFQYAHLKEDLQAISKPFGDLAEFIVEATPKNPERTTALRKLLEAKDCAVRAFLYKIG